MISEPMALDAEGLDKMADLLPDVMTTVHHVLAVLKKSPGRRFTVEDIAIATGAQASEIISSLGWIGLGEDLASLKTGKSTSVLELEVIDGRLHLYHPPH